MKRIIIVLVIVFAVFGGVIGFSGAQKTTTSSSRDAAAQESEFGKVEQAVAGGAKLYDVRTADEFATGHFENAVNWPLQDLQAGKLPDVSKDTKIYVYCHSGNRSGQSTMILKQAGYTNVTDLHGVANVEALGGRLVTN
jgi:rhodanese-related sulfurtransferase